MLFSSMQIKAKYDSDEDDILRAFYMPLLSNSTRYDRAVGYFSSDVLASAVSGLESFVLSQGKMRLIIGDPLSDSEYEAVMAGANNPALARSFELSELLLDKVNYGTTKLHILTYLVANEQLEIKFAFTHKGMFHKKVGVFYQDSETVVFSGSANETLAGLSKYNSEEISVFFSWRDSFNDYGKIEVENFEALWNNKKKRVKVIPLDSSIYQKIQSRVDLSALRRELLTELSDYDLKTEEPFFRYSFPKSAQQLITPEINSKVPRKPLMVRGKAFELFPHQRDAISSWEKADHQGLFKLATGSGKTFTSISALVELYESRSRKIQPTFVIISVPYIELANQWVEELSAFNIMPVRCYEDSNKWSEILDTKVIRFRNQQLDFVCIVVVNKTLSTDLFQTKLEKVSRQDMLFIGDECHRLASDGIFSSLPQCKYRIGLSATPFRDDDDEIEGSLFPNEAKKNLITYFRGVTSEYSLSDAIQDGVLAPYRYELVPVYLEDKEQVAYNEYSLKIQRMILKAQSNKLSLDERQALTNLCGLRSRLIATCKGKLPALTKYLNEARTLSVSHSLVYVGEGHANDDYVPYITRVTNALHEQGMRVAKFTSVETTNERRQIMDNFKNKVIDSLVAMKVLDEGIDVPVCRTAFILASTRNPRQYVQRRGRVLRKSEGKREALIVDFIVLPRPDLTDKSSQGLRKAELGRVNDFKLTALNPLEVEEKLSELGIGQ